MNEEVKIESTDEAWESRQLGADEEFVKVSSEDEEAIDEALALQMISIRLQKSLIHDLKNIAKINGIGYQPLIKQVLKRFVDGEKRLMLRRLATEQTKRDKEYEDSQCSDKRHCA